MSYALLVLDLRLMTLPAHTLYVHYHIKQTLFHVKRFERKQRQYEIENDLLLLTTGSAELRHVIQKGSLLEIQA